MQEFEEEDLYDCEIYTNEVINSQNDEEDTQEEEEKNILLCPNCGFTYNYNNPPKDYRGRKINIEDYKLSSVPGYFRCPLCSKVIPYAYISEEEYNTIEKVRKRKEEERERKKEKQQKKKDDAYFKINVSKFNDSLTNIQKDLQERLFNGEISKNRFSYLYKKLVLNLYNKYERVFQRCNRDFQKSDLIYTANKINDDVIATYEKKNKSDKYIDDLREDMEEDEIYLKNNKEYIEDIEFFEDDMDIDDYLKRENFKEHKKNFEKRHEELLKEEKIENEKFEKEVKRLSEHNKGRIDKLNESIKYKNKK